jgi:hypothetical protein
MLLQFGSHAVTLGKTHETTEVPINDIEESLSGSRELLPFCHEKDMEAL